MKKYLKQHQLLIAFTIVVLLLCFCGFQTTAVDDHPTEIIPITEGPILEVTQPATESAVDLVTEPYQTSYVYECAIEDYMVPIEEHSWKREHEPEFVMIHFSSAIMNHPDDPYNVELVRDIFLDYGVSVHYVVERDGTVHCYIPEDRVAWHAGSGHWGDFDKYTNKMNHYAIGIEVLAIGSENDMSVFMNSKKYQTIDKSLIGYTQAQYNALQLLVADICERNNIPLDRAHIIGHEEYTDGKPDPGELFDWSQIVPANQ